MRLLVCVSWVLQSRQTQRHPRRRTILVQAQLLANVPRRSSVITVTTDSRLAQLTARTSRLRSRLLDIQANRWRIRIHKAQTVPSSRLALTVTKTWVPLPRTALYRIKTRIGAARLTLAPMEVSHGTKVRSHTICPRTSTNPCRSRMARWRTSSSLFLALTRKYMRSSLMELLAPGSSTHSNHTSSSLSNSSSNNQASTLHSPRQVVSDPLQTSPIGTRCRCTRLNSSNSSSSISSSRTTLSASCRVRTWVAYPVPWSIPFRVAGRVRISILRVRLLFLDLPTTRLSHLSLPNDRLLVTATCLKVCRIHWRGRCPRSLRALRMDLLIMVCTLQADLVCQLSHSLILYLSQSSRDSLLQMLLLFRLSLCRVTRCSSSTRGSHLPAYTRCRHKALV